MPKLIGLLGKSGSGKSVVANWLTENREYKEFAFAAALKDACKIIFGLTHEQLYGGLKDTYDSFYCCTPRHILQQVGCGLFRDELPHVLPELPLHDKSVWILHFDKIFAAATVPIVVSDVRFMNEAKNIKEKGGVLIRIIRPSVLEYTDSHCSETESDGIEHDYCIVNDGDIDDLHRQLYTLF